MGRERDHRFGGDPRDTTVSPDRALVDVYDSTDLSSTWWCLPHADTQRVRPCSSHGFPTRDGPPGHHYKVDARSKRISRQMVNARLELINASHGSTRGVHLQCRRPKPQTLTNSVSSQSRLPGRDRCWSSDSSQRVPMPVATELCRFPGDARVCGHARTIGRPSSGDVCTDRRTVGPVRRAHRDVLAACPRRQAPEEGHPSTSRVRRGQVPRGGRSSRESVNTE
jgi:hypothetical protein